MQSEPSKLDGQSNTVPPYDCMKQGGHLCTHLQRSVRSFVRDGFNFIRGSEVALNKNKVKIKLSPMCDQAQIN